jgi:PAS domain S-box-containing protein
VCFEDCGRERGWSVGDKSILQALAACLGGALSRRQSEQAMLSSVRKYRSLFETSRDGIVIVDMAGRVEDANPAYLDMLGYGFEDLARLTYQALTPAPWVKLDADMVREQVLPRGYSDEYEKEYLRRDGTAHPASVRVWLVRDAEGRPARMWRIVRDISERKKMEQALRASERQLRTIVDKLPVGVWLTDAQGKVILCNPAGERIWGEARFSGIEQYGQFAGWWHGTGRRLQPHEWAPVRALSRGETYVNEVIDIEDVYGVRKTVSYSALPVRDDADRIAGIVVINEDITERTRAEQRLRQSGDRHRRITEALSDYVYTVWIADGRVVGTDHGAACEAVTGYSRDDFAANPYLWLRMVLEEDRAAVLEQGRRSLAGEAAPPLEHRIMRKDGQVRWVRNTVVLHHDPQGRLLCYDGVIQDVSDRKRSESSLRFTQFALDASSVPVYWLDAEGRIVYANSAAAGALGYSGEELRRLRLWDIDPVLKPERWAGFWDRLKRERSLALEGSGRAKDGRLFPTETFATFLELDGTERCFAFVHDITERRRSEEAQGS